MSELTKLYQEIAACQRCQMLAQTRTNVVPGEGPEHADIMFIGEAPGFHEDRQGRPFVGAAGQFLDELLQSISMNRQEVYIPLFHPAAALHQTRYRSLIEEDFSRIPQILADFDALEAQNSQDDQAEQLSLF